MKIQEQKWHDFTRLLIVALDNTGIHNIIGSVQVELYPDAQDEYGTTAYIYGLWVEEHKRRKRIATTLMDVAEDEIKKRGHKKATLQWKLQDTPRDILAWCERRGYDEKSFDGRETRSLMVKEL